MITVSHISKSFSDVHAVNDLSFSLKQGEVVGLLGPNGAGKTTTMRMLTGFLTPDTGTIEIDGISVLSDPIKIQERIGYLPENNPLYKDMLVSELLSYSGKLKGLSGKKLLSAIDFSVKSVSISDVYHRPIGQLSKGYRQRVGVALALLHRPKILILDEPSEGLDPNQRTDIRTLIKSLAKEHTIIMSTHVMREVEAVCSRLLIVHKGQLVADGTPGQIAKKAGSKRTVVLVVEGKQVEPTLKGINGVEAVQTKMQKDGKVEAIVTLAPSAKIQPNISALAWQHKWIIWKLVEESEGLESVFHTLTGGETV